MSCDPIRRTAWRILRAEASGQGGEGRLEEELARLADPRDRGFLAELVRGTLQWQGRYDHLLKSFVRKAPPRRSGVQEALRLGLHQILALDSVPPFAAIDQTVRLVKQEIHPRWAGFVNGTLRQVHRAISAEEPGSGLSAAGKERLRAFFTDPKLDEDARLAAWQSLPEWLVRRWSARFGPERCAALCAFVNRPVPLDFHVLAPMDPAAARAELLAAGCATEPAGPERCLRAAARPGRQELAAWLDRFPWLIVQDAGVQEATAWLAGFLDQAPPGPVLDMCAAPGGKSVHLSALLAGTRDVAAMEPDLHRLELLSGTLSRCGVPRLQALAGNGLRPPLRPGSLAAVLLDGPCSGTGVLRRHPEARWRLRPETPGRKAAVLLELASRAADLLAEGGVLMYATCSLEDEENLAVVQALKRARPQLQVLADAQGRRHRRWLPPESPGDGFFAAALVNRKVGP